MIPIAPTTAPSQTDLNKPTVCTMPKLHKPGKQNRRLTADVKCQSQPAAASPELPESPQPAS